MTHKESTTSLPRTPWYSRFANGLTRALPGFLPCQRWYAGKSLAIERVRVIDACRISPSPPVTVCLVDVEDIDEGHTTYSLVVGVGHDEDHPSVLCPSKDERGAWLFEAGLDEDALRQLLSGFEFPGGHLTALGGSVRFTTIENASEPALPDPARGTTLEPLGTDQSNTILRVGVRRTLKLFRRLVPGEHLELEIGRFLTKRTSFTGFPRLHGAIQYHPPQGQPLVLAVLQDFVESEAGGWNHVCSLIGQLRGGHPVLDALTQDVRELGRTTAQLHLALASNRDLHAFAPEPVTTTDRSRWLESLARRCSRVLSWLHEHEVDFSEAERAPLERLVRDLVDDPKFMSLDVRGFEKIRIHGDYHLGQTLKTKDGFVILDFEGEPSRPLDERRAKHCALKDVAGMLRSFDYALALAPDGPLTDHAQESAALRGAFLEGYDSLARGTAFLPPDDEAFTRWMDFFEIDKAIYELEYEIGHRPELASVPLSSIAGMVERMKR